MKAYKLPYDVALDRLGPHRGPCAFCGSTDARHRLLDVIRSRHHAGERPAAMAAEYGYSEALIREVVALKGEEG